LNRGLLATTTLAEVLGVDFVQLFRSVFPDADGDLGERVEAIARLGIAARMAAMGALLNQWLGSPAKTELQRHPSDTVRGWACFMIGDQDGPLLQKLAAIRPLADDPHFGVREWAWLAVRPSIADDVESALALLADWTGDSSERIRRFASEATRPRGVWCKHIPALKTHPESGRNLLDPLRSDPSIYVQDSVANWLNDAAKTRPDWVRLLVADWLHGVPSSETRRIARRALRSIDRIKSAKE
jgi:3-methyladenine DNA glycosylase AlkC